MERRMRPNKHTKSISKINPKTWHLLASSISLIVLFFTIALITIPTLKGWNSYKQIKSIDSQLKNIINLEGTYLYRDEALTMTLNMAATTGDNKWIKRYEELGKRIKPQVDPDLNIPSTSTIASDVVLTDFAYEKLNELENDILKQIQESNKSKAKNVLRSPEYEDQKQTYARGMKSFVINTRRILEERTKSYWKNLHIAVISVVFVLPCVVLVLLTINKAGKYLCQRAEVKRQGLDFGKEWQETFNAITDSVCILDKDGGKILHCNKAMTRLLKKPYNEIIGQSCCEILHNTKEPIKKCPYVRMLNTRRSEETDIQIGDKWVNIKVDPLIDHKGNLTGAVHIISDKTKHRDTNRALRESENKFRLAFANAQDAIVWVETESGCITNCNKAFEELFGKSKKEIIGQHHTLLYPEDKKDLFLNLLTESGRDTNSIIDAEILGPNGNIKLVTIARSAMQVDGSDIVQGIIRDVTESKKAIEEVKNLAKFPSEDPNPVLRISSDSKILYANDASLPVLETWHTHEGENLPQNWSTRIEEVYKSGISSTIELNCDDGHIFVITLQPVQDGGYVNAYGLDITNRKKAEKEKMDLELQLSQKQKMEAIGTLAGGIAHDFNNILAALQGYTELSLDDLPEDSPIKDNLEQILACSNRATKLVKQILTFSRKNEQEQEKEPVIISAIIKEVLAMLRSSLPTTINIKRNIIAETSMVLADPTQIHQILVNLCTNSSHAMGQEAGNLEVSLTDTHFESQVNIGDDHLNEGSYVKLSISDTGCGMEPEVLKRIFEPFFTTKKLNEGTGLGLPVVHGIVKSHGGAIDVTSTPGQGTTFDIYFPKIQNENPDEQNSAEPVTRDKKVILLVDDEEMMVDVTSQILTRLGYEVVSKTNSLDALKEFQEKPDEFDLILTDQVMPNMTGTQLSSAIISIRPDIPIILCSGFPEKICTEELNSIGIKQFIMKPVSRQVITSAVESALNKENVPV